LPTGFNEGQCIRHRCATKFPLLLALAPSASFSFDATFPPM